MTTLFAAATIEVTTSEPVSSKTAYLLRARLQTALDEAACNVLDEFGIPNENVHTVLVEEVEIEGEPPVFAD